MLRRPSSSEAAAITCTDVTYGRREAVDQTDRDAFVAAAPAVVSSPRCKRGPPARTGCAHPHVPGHSVELSL